MRRYLIILVCLLSTYSLADDGPLRVVASEIPPCVFQIDGSPSGFSIDLWDAIANELGMSYEVSMTSFVEKLSAIRQGTADIGIGCISITRDREETMDFTHPVALGGLAAVSLIETGVFPRFSDSSKMMLLTLLLLVIFFSHIMWFAERGEGSISGRYFPGIFEAFWFSIVTMSTVGYGDISPHRWIGKVGALLVILTGVTAFGIIVGQFAADATRVNAQHPVTSTEDLRSFTVGVKRGTASQEFLQPRGIQIVEFDELDDLIAGLREGRIQIMVHDAMTMEYMVQRSADLIRTGPMFESHYFGIALPEESQLRERINRILLDLQKSGLYTTIRDRWF